MLAAIQGALILLAEIGCVVVLVGWVAVQVIEDLQEIARTRRARHRRGLGT